MKKIYYSRRGICLAQTITQEEECLHFAPAKDDKYYHVCKHREENGKYRGEEAFLRCLLGEDIFIGTDSEAAAEANRRSDAYERETGKIISNVVMESHGKIINY